MSTDSMFGGPAGGAEHGLQAVLAAIAAETERIEKPPAGWGESLFRHFKRGSPVVTGSMFEEVLRRWLCHYGFEITPRENTDHDMVVNGVSVEVKGATLNSGGRFMFSQVRDQDYELIAFLGLTAERACLWIETKADAWEFSKVQSRESNLRKHFPRPSWVGPSTDGSLASALRFLREQTKRGTTERNLSA